MPPDQEIQQEIQTAASSEPKENPTEPVSIPTTDPNPTPVSDTPEVPPEPQNGPTEVLPSQTQNVPLPPTDTDKRNFVMQLLVSARNAIQFRKRKKIDHIMTLFIKHPKITNDEVEKLLHVSNATATRYLSQLEKEGKIKQMGKTGAGVFYVRI